MIPSASPIKMSFKIDPSSDSAVAFDKIMDIAMEKAREKFSKEPFVVALSEAGMICDVDYSYDWKTEGLQPMIEFKGISARGCNLSDYGTKNRRSNDHEGTESGGGMTLFRDDPHIGRAPKQTGAIVSTPSFRTSFAILPAPISSRTPSRLSAN